MMPTTTINACDCPGATAPVSGVIIDGVIPSIDTAEQGWASELFTVNRNGQDQSFTIGFQFSDFFHLRYVEIIFLNCQLWGIGLSAVNIYSSQVFPQLGVLNVSATNIGMLSLVDDVQQSCTSLRTISIPLPLTLSIQNYFIEFFLVGSGQHPLSWLHIAEIRFSDMAPTTSIPTNTGKYCN